MAWSPDGTRLATVGKDHMVRIYEPRSSTHPVKEGAGPNGSRGARVVWVDNEHIVVSGFNRYGREQTDRFVAEVYFSFLPPSLPPHPRTSTRTLHLYSAQDLTKPQSSVATNVSPATLIPYYDPDTHLLFLSGKVQHSPINSKCIGIP